MLINNSIHYSDWLDRKLNTILRNILIFCLIFFKFIFFIKKSLVLNNLSINFATSIFYAIFMYFLVLLRMSIVLVLCVCVCVLLNNLLLSFKMKFDHSGAKAKLIYTTPFPFSLQCTGLHFSYFLILLITYGSGNVYSQRHWTERDHAPLPLRFNKSASFLDWLKHIWLIWNWNRAWLEKCGFSTQKSV